MGQIKKLDVAGFESRVDSYNLNISHFDTFLKADKALVEADAILSECGIEGITPIGYESRAEKIGKLGEDASLLLKYPDELIDGLQAVDSAFAKGVQKATEALSTIRIDDIRIKNTFDTEIIRQSENQETSESTLKEYLTMEDLVRSFDELSPQETSFVKEFTDLLYAPYATKNIALDAMVTEKEDEIQELLNGSDHDADKYHPAKEFLREILGVLTSGNYSSSIAAMGSDPITKDVFSEEERKALALSRTPQALKFAFTFGADTKLDELIAYISKPQGGMASLLSSNTYEAMTASRLETYLLTATSGVAVGYSLAHAGMSFLDFYQKHRQKILQNMAKGTSSRAPAYSTSISANQQNNADSKIDEDALKGAKVLEYKLSLITKEDGSLKYTEKEIQEMIDYVLRKYPISLSSLYHIPSQYYPNQMEICLKHAKESLEPEYDVTIPKEISGNIGDDTIILYPRERWGICGGGVYGESINVDDSNRYRVAVGPTIIDSDYPDSGYIWRSDFDFPIPIDLYLKNKETEEITIIHCVVEDIKAHTYNSYPQEKVYFDVPNGMFQTGIAYPNSWNYTHEDPFASDHKDGSVIEFMGGSVDFNISDYTLEGIKIVE